MKPDKFVLEEKIEMKKHSREFGVLTIWFTKTWRAISIIWDNIFTGIAI